MNNKLISKILTLIGVTIGFMTLIFEFTLRKEIGHTTVLASIQFWIGLLIAVIVLYAGYYISILKEPKKITKIISEEPKKEKKTYDFSDLNEDEEKTLKSIIENKSIPQKDLIEKLKINKVKMTRILNKLEEKDAIIRERHGMNNVVVLKD